MQKLRYYRQVFATGGCTTAGGGASSSGANQVGTRRKRHPPPLREKKLKEKQKNKEKDAELAQSTVVDRNPDSQEDSKPVNFISAFWLSFFSSTFFSLKLFCIIQNIDEKYLQHWTLSRSWTSFNQVWPLTQFFSVSFLWKANQWPLIGETLFSSFPPSNSLVCCFRNYRDTRTPPGVLC